MSAFEFEQRPRTSEAYSGHHVFGELEQCIEFYESLSDLIFGQITLTRSYLGNLDSCFFDSFSGTLESIRTVLLAGRIADAYTLMRRFSETTWLHVYVMLRFYEASHNPDAQQEKIGDMDFNRFMEELDEAIKRGIYIEEVEDWLTGSKTLPRLSVFSKTIANTPSLGELNTLFDPVQYDENSQRCNDHVHLNYFRNLRLNDKNASDEVQMAWLEQFARDFRDLFIRHIAYVFFIHPEYMASSDYVDMLECGQTPIEGSQYWVARFVQEIFDSLVTTNRPDIKAFLKKNSFMELS